MSSPETLPKLDRVHLEESAYLAIKEAILSLRFAPGDPLLESNLARQLGVSKTPVRVALARLESEGLVESMPNRATRVAKMTAKDIHEIFDIRQILEPYCVKMAAAVLKREDLDALRDTVARSEEALEKHDVVLLSHLLGEFDRILIDRAGNERMRSIAGTLRHQWGLVGSVSRRLPERASKSIAEHKLILEALGAGDADAAEERMKAHLMSLRSDALRLVERE